MIMLNDKKKNFSSLYVEKKIKYINFISYFLILTALKSFNSTFFRKKIKQ